MTALCHVGSNLVPSGSGCQAFADLAGKSGARMLIGEAGAVSDLWAAARADSCRGRGSIDQANPSTRSVIRLKKAQPACGLRP